MDLDRFANVLERRETLIENTVDENETMPVGLAKSEALQIGGLEADRISEVAFATRGLPTFGATLRGRTRQTENPFSDRCYAGEMPILVFRRWVSKCLKARHSLLTKIVQPRRTGRLALEILSIHFDR